MNRNPARKHSTDILFVLVLFLVFTSSALAVILLGARVYQSTSSRMESNYNVRTALAYVSERSGRMMKAALSRSVTWMGSLPSHFLREWRIPPISPIFIFRTEP